ncbi:MAG: hypothetical protein ACRCZI_06745 [Cetobacterium sp.]
MGLWHYQIQQFIEDGLTYYMIVEVYRNGPVTKNGAAPYGETPEELIKVLEMMLKDARKYSVLKAE